MGNKLGRDALEGKGAIVTGANSGIGAAVVRKLLEYGMVIVGIDTETDYLDVISLNIFIFEYVKPEASVGILVSLINSRN